MTNIIEIFTLIISVSICANYAAKILAVFPMPMYSHQISFRPITQELVRRGHEVTVITPLPAFPKGQAPNNLREIDVQEVTYRKLKENIANFRSGDDAELLNQSKIILSFISIFAEVQLLHPEVQALINNKNETFDLLLLEMCVRPILIFSHLYKVPVIQISSMGGMVGIHETIGTLTHTVLFPTAIQQKLFNLTTWDKITGSYMRYSYEKLLLDQEAKDNAMIRKIFDEGPSLSELKNNVTMVFLNVHAVWEKNRPLPPNVIHIGGIHVKPSEELPQDLKFYLDSSKHGVIYFSFGTSVPTSSLRTEKIQTFLNVFSELPYDILWKYDKDDLPRKPDNVRIEKWLPQADLLRHPNIKLFITQGGLQSTDEAITGGVPMIVVPMLGDQWYNAEHYVHHRIGIKLDFETVTEEIFKNAIDAIIRNESYRHNIERLRAIVHDQPQRPLERAIWWIEHVLRHGGGSHLRSQAMGIPWAQYYEISLASVPLILITTVVSSIVYALYNLLRFIRPYSLKIKKA